MGKHPITIIVRSGTRENGTQEENLHPRRSSYSINDRDHKGSSEATGTNETAVAAAAAAAVAASTTTPSTGIALTSSSVTRGRPPRASVAVLQAANNNNNSPTGVREHRGCKGVRANEDSALFDGLRTNGSSEADKVSVRSQKSLEPVTASEQLKLNSIFREKLGSSEVVDYAEQTTTVEKRVERRKALLRHLLALFAALSYYLSCPKIRSNASKTFFLALLAMCMLFESVFGVPTPAPASSHDLARPPDSTRGRTEILEFEEAFEEEEDVYSRNELADEELEIIRRSIVQSLGLQRIPDPSKANVSQAEYERAHREYLKKVQLSHHGQEPRKRRKLHIFYAAAEHPGNKTEERADEQDAENGENNDDDDDEEAAAATTTTAVPKYGTLTHKLFFPVEIPEEDEEEASKDDSTIDHASLRFFLPGHHRSHQHLEIVLYLKERGKNRRRKRSIGRKRISINDPRDSRWLELDATEAVVAWLVDERENLGLELEFLENAKATKRKIVSPVLNVFTTSYPNEEGDSVDPKKRRKRATTPEHLMSIHRGRRTECRGDSKKCCRHEMTVIFKDLKGFDFIAQPKDFDAGFCKGRCPPRYNPAHHHALLQSLMWKEDRRKIPRPCCAPSKLSELEILYFDENDPTKLKVSNWNNMRVLECACS